MSSFLDNYFQTILKNEVAKNPIKNIKKRKQISSPSTNVTKKSEQISSRFTEIVEGTQDDDVKLARIKWEEYKYNNKNTHNITPTEGDTLEIYGNMYRLLTGFYFQNKELDYYDYSDPDDYYSDPDGYGIKINVCVTDLKTNKDRVIDWLLPPHASVRFDSYLSLHGVFSNITEKIKNINSNYIITGGFFFGQKSNGEKVIYRPFTKSQVKDDCEDMWETWALSATYNLPKNEIIFLDTLLREGPRSEFDKKNANYYSSHYVERYDDEPEESELSIWYDAHYDD